MVEIKFFTASDIEFKELSRIDNLVYHDSFSAPDNIHRINELLQSMITISNDYWKTLESYRSNPGRSVRMANIEYTCFAFIVRNPLKDILNL